MKYAELKAFFPPDRHADIDGLYARFKERHDPGGEILRFIRYLGIKGVLSSKTMRDLLTLGPVDIRRLPGDGKAFYKLQRDRLRYRQLGLLGEGAMGEVQIAVDEDLHRTVAVKRIHSDHEEHEKLAKRFYTEAQITAQLDHPNIVPVYSFEASESGGLSYAMKIVRGETLSDYLAEAQNQIAENGQADEAHALPARLVLFNATCAALGYAHSRGVIHRDLKPDNIMVGAFDEVLVMDWGIARELADTEIDDVTAFEDQGKTHQTQAGSVIGTPRYMSPEQAQGLNDQLTAKSDQYALGLILYEIVTLRPAIPGGELIATVLRAAEGEKAPIRPATKKGRVPRELVAIIDKATATEPGDRYADVGALAADVRRYLANEAVLARPDGPLQKLMRWMSKNRATALTLFFGLLLVAAGVAGVVYFTGQATLARERAAAEQREEALVKVAGLVSRRAREVDGAFDRYEELLTGMVYAAELSLSQPAPRDQRVWLCKDFAEPTGQPADLAPSAIYDKAISVRELCQELAPGVDASDPDVRGLLKQIARLSHAFFRAKLESHSAEALDLPRETQEKLIRDDGVPAAYTYMGTPQGILATYPGRDTQRTDYDPRKRPWYAPATRQRGPVWIAADSLSDLSGLLLTCAMAVRAPDDTLMAVAAIDLEFARIIDAFLEQPEIEAETETYFLTSKGEVILSSALRDVAGKVKDFEPEPFPHQELLPRFRKAHSGQATVEGRLVLWDRISTTGWTYAVVGADEALIGQ